MNTTEIKSMAQNMEVCNEPNPNFIEGITSKVELSELINDCIIPTFSNGELTISHQSFIAAVVEAGKTVFGENSLMAPEIRVSHKIMGRVPEAVDKPKELLEQSDLTQYWQRLAFIVRFKTEKKMIDGKECYLSIAGTHSYADDKIFSKPSPMKFKVVINYTMRVCSNGCIFADNYTTIEAMTTTDIYEKCVELFSRFDKEKSFNDLHNLTRTYLTEDEFTGILGKMRLYSALPATEIKELGLPRILINDTMWSGIARAYVENENFGRQAGELSLFNMLNLITEQTKQCYPDVFLERCVNATEICSGLQRAIERTNDQYGWFLN